MHGIEVLLVDGEDDAIKGIGGRRALRHEASLAPGGFVSGDWVGSCECDDGGEPG